MKLVPAIAALSLGVAGFVLPSAVRAAPSGGACTYVASFQPGTTRAGSVVSVKGDAFVASQNGWQALEPGASLSPGAYLRVGPQSSAVIAVGGQQFTLAANAVMSMLPSSGGLCVRVRQTTTQAGLPNDANAPAAGGGAGPGAGAGAGAGGFTGSSIGLGIAALDVAVTGTYTLGLNQPVSR